METFRADICYGKKYFKEKKKFECIHTQKKKKKNQNSNGTTIIFKKIKEIEFLVLCMP